MSLKLAIDYGNTRVKVGVFKEKQLIEKRNFSNIEENLLKSYIEDFEQNGTIFSGSIISSVIHIPNGIFSFLSKKMPTLTLSHTLNLPYEMLYETPETLGNDRIAIAASAVCKYPSKDTLVIDAGTCVTYDFIDKQNRYY
jgi:type III pantothenate kinase